MSPSIFNFNNAAVRVFNTEDGPRFVALDACEILGLSNPRSSLWLLDDDEKGVHTVDTPGGPQSVTVITEGGLYCLILCSRKPEARAFKKWVTSEVLPAIRKTGAYSVPAAPQFQLPTTFAEALQLAADQARELDAAKLQLADAAPKVDFHDAVTASSTVVTMAVAAQTAKLPFGQNTLYRKLREMGVLISGGTRHNLPKQQYIEQGLFTVDECKIHHNSGEVEAKFTTHVTQKGIVWLVARFGKEGKAA